MISIKQWGVLLLVYLFYLLTGALVFLSLEAEYELQKLQEKLILQKRLSINLHFIEDEKVRVEIRSIVTNLGMTVGEDLLITNEFQEELLRRIVPKEELPPDSSEWNSTELLEEVVPQFMNVSSNLTQLKSEFLGKHPLDAAVLDQNIMWTLWNSFFFSFTAITTIGFGHMAPSTDGGRLFCIIYSLLGVPLNGILFASLADLFAWRFTEKIDGDGSRDTKTVIAATILYLLPGLMVMVIFPSALFMLVEDWSFLDSIYFSFISLMTIGFGDFVAGYHLESGIGLWFYRTGIMVWLIFGLGYLFMVIAFIQRALRSEEVRALDRKMRHTLKEKVAAMHGNVIKDLDNLRAAMESLAKNERESTVKGLEIQGNKEVSDEIVEDLQPNGAGPSKSLDAKMNRRKSHVETFLEIAGTILQESEEDLEATVGHYNEALDLVDENNLNGNQNEFATEISFPDSKTEEAEPSKPRSRRASIWVSTPPITFNLPPESSCKKPKKVKLKFLDSILDSVRSQKTKPPSRSVANRRPTMYPTIEERRDSSDSDQSAISTELESASYPEASTHGCNSNKSRQ